LNPATSARLTLDAVIVRAVHAAIHRTWLAADAAGLQVGEALDQLLLELLLAPDVLLRLLELGTEQRAQLFHRLGAMVRLPPALEHLLRLVEREPEAVQEVDPAHPVDHGRVVEPEAAARARGRLDQPQLLVEMDRADGLPRQSGDIADSEVAGCRSVSLGRWQYPYAWVRVWLEASVLDGVRQPHGAHGRENAGNRLRHND
jgi:hypothetical protein